MAGVGERDTLMKHTDDYNPDDDRDDDDDTTMPFQTNGASTPAPPGEEISMQTMRREKSGLPETSYAETSFIEKDSVEDIERRLNILRNERTGLLNKKDVPNDKFGTGKHKQNEIQKVKDLIKKLYPKVDFGKLIIRFRTKGIKGRNSRDIVSVGPEGGEVKIALDDGSGLRKDFVDRAYVKKVLGKPAKKIIAEENAIIRESRKRIKKKKSRRRTSKVRKNLFRKRKS